MDRGGGEASGGQKDRSVVAKEAEGACRETLQDVIGGVCARRRAHCPLEASTRESRSQ